ncbi:protein-lysine N-methyltransferase EEF2KMT [Drosophila rhopaloa]|uniref:Protein-lysine N-methyltransferase EEF2KMT n=1 Tax=Drosophila rhopaloa TaxID=1041015 RepID=A0A6P4EFS2_DRORH|nr:protein-lysine N-methyltransferase EEF2KMT [Drosophila rhopaloa]
MSEKYGKLQQQFLCCYPVNKMAWSSVKLPLNWDEQQELLAATCGHPMNRRHPVRRSYLEAFLKQLMHLLKDQEDVHDDIYSRLCGGLGEGKGSGSGSGSGTSYAYKHYLISPGAHITLRECNSFVSEGTTGLCTWEAALALADYVLQHRDLVSGKNIVELGAGAGLVGILLKLPGLELKTGQVLLTDGSEPCVQLMRENIALNFHNTPVEEMPQAEQLDWDAVAEFPWKSHADTDLLLAADVIYDDSQFDALLGALDYFYTRRGGQLETLLASTVRNVDTLHKFMTLLGLHGYKVTPCANVSACASHFCRDHTAAVQIISIRR